MTPVPPPSPRSWARAVSLENAAIARTSTSAQLARQPYLVMRSDEIASAACDMGDGYRQFNSEVSMLAWFEPFRQDQRVCGREPFNRRNAVIFAAAICSEPQVASGAKREDFGESALWDRTWSKMGSAEQNGVRADLIAAGLP